MVRGRCSCRRVSTRAGVAGASRGRRGSSGETEKSLVAPQVNHFARAARDRRAKVDKQPRLWARNAGKVGSWEPGRGGITNPGSGGVPLRVHELLHGEKNYAT